MEAALSTCQFCGKVLERLRFPWGVSGHVNKPCECLRAAAHREDQDRVERERVHEKQERDRRDSIRRMFEEIPEHFRNRTFESFQPGPNADALALAQGFPFSDGKKGLMFIGTPGTGKTHLAVAIGIGQIRMCRSVVFGTVPAILAKIRATYDSAGPTEAEVMNAITGCSLLILDDLGKEKPSEWVDEKLYEIVNSRYVRGLPLIITTNVGLEAVKSRYQWSGAAIVSRLFEMCRGVQMRGEDYRRKIR